MTSWSAPMATCARITESPMYRRCCRSISLSTLSINRETPTVRANLFAASIGLLCVAGCGGGSGLANGGGGGGGGTPPTGANVQAIVVDSGPTPVATSSTPAINTAYTTVTICAPGSTSNCQTIDHIQVDTGSSGLRILQEVL